HCSSIAGWLPPVIQGCQYCEFTSWEADAFLRHQLLKHCRSVDLPKPWFPLQQPEPEQIHYTDDDRDQIFVIRFVRAFWQSLPGVPGEPYKCTSPHCDFQSDTQSWLFMHRTFTHWYEPVGV